MIAGSDFQSAANAFLPGEYICEIPKRSKQLCEQP